MGGAHYKWRHSHSYYLGHYTGTNGSQERVIAYRPNGIDLHFFNENGKYISLANRQWTLTKEVDSEQQHIGWTLQVGNIIEKYDTQGRVLRVENEQGQGVSYTYKSNGTKLDVVADDNGSTLTFNSYYKEQPSRITLNDGTVYSFSYESDGLLRSISYPATSYTTKNFYYEDPRFRQALTSIKDERGNIYATFVYDERGRAIHSEHAGGADSIDIEYIDKNTRRLTNALGKQTTYHYSDVDGAKRITLVQGEASTNCAAANQTYTYDVNGFVSSQTDWNGITTTYVHNARGLETSRTEAAGTPEARTITTEWHPEFRLPVRITEPDQITEFTYDDQGRLLSRDERSVQ